MYTLNFTVTLFGQDRDRLDRLADVLQAALTNEFDYVQDEAEPRVKLLIGQNTVSVV